MSVQIEDAALRKLQANLDEFRRLKVRIGYQDDEGKATHPDAEISVAKLAAVHEFGSPGDGIPERSFIRSTLEIHEAEIAAAMEKAAKAVVRDQATPVAAMSTVGRLAVDLVRKRLENASTWAEQLDPRTAELKGSPNVLDASGTLAAALSWRVSRGRETLARGK